MTLLAFACFFTAGADCARAQAASESRPLVRQRGNYVHDPSTLVQNGAEYWMFSTGNGIRSWRSADLKKWLAGPAVFSKPPEWTTNAVPGFRGYFWAPDVIRNQDHYSLYYSVSSWGKNTSSIGLATNLTLNPDDPRFCWGDAGPVVESHPNDTFNAIDPSVLRTRDGSLWLAFGSFWSGIKLIQLDPNSGKRIAADSPVYSVAHHETIEAACLCQLGGYYYLFVNWGLCCRGTNSTYTIRIGRSGQVTGPYLDRQGHDLMDGGGTLFLGNEENRVGPGHAGIYSDQNTHRFSYHYYDATRGGVATFAVRQLQLDPDGWPKLGPATDSTGQVQGP